MKQLPLLVLMALAAAAAARAAQSEVTITVKDTKGAPVADTVVSLIPLDAVVPPPAPDAAGEIAQQDQEFTAYVTVVQAGSRVVFPNKDTVQHHVYSLSKAKKFELPLYNPGRAESFVFDQPGLITLGCNIHDWMLAYLVVVPTPYYAKTGNAGAATVPAPAGRYRLELWHPRLAAALTQEIVLTDGTAVTREITVTLKPDRRIRRGPESKSGGYR
jgi:plastocyanin